MRKKEKTLIILSPGFPKDESDTTFMPTQQGLIRSINKYFPEIKVIIIAFYYPGFAAEYNWFGNKIISLNGSNQQKVFRLLTWLKVWFKLLQLKRKYNIIGLLSFWATECAVTGNFFSKIFSLKHFTWILGQDAKQDNKYIKFYQPSGQSLIAISDTITDEFYKNHGIKPAHVIYNGISASSFTRSATNRTIDVLGAGSLIPLKQYDVFIDVVNTLKNEFPEVNAKICGGGPEYQNLLNKIRNLGLETHVQLTGTLQHKETIYQMQQAKVFLHTSIYEGFSTACLEALYAGAHVVSFCFPMHEKIPNWHVVKTQEEMQQKVIELLTGKNIDYEPVLIQSIDESAAEIMKLFGY